MKRIIGIFNLKGGVGKTVSTVSIASCLSQYFGKRVLVIDTDPSTDLTGFFMEAIKRPRREAFTNTLKDVLQGKCAAKEAIRKFTFYRIKGIKEFFTGMESEVQDETIDVIGPDMVPLRSCRIDFIPGDEEILGLSKNEIIKFGVLLNELDYDIILVDFSPEVLMNYTVFLLFGIKYLIIPAEATRSSIDGFSRILDLIRDAKEYAKTLGYNLQINILGLFFTRVQKSQSLPKEMIRQIREAIEGSFVFKTVIYESSSANKCISYGIAPTIMETSSQFVDNYKNLTREILRKTNSIEK